MHTPHDVRRYGSATEAMTIYMYDGGTLPPFATRARGRERFCIALTIYFSIFIYIYYIAREYSL